MRNYSSCSFDDGFLLKISKTINRTRRGDKFDVLLSTIVKKMTIHLLCDRRFPSITLNISTYYYSFQLGWRGVMIMNPPDLEGETQAGPANLCTFLILPFLLLFLPPAILSITF